MRKCSQPAHGSLAELNITPLLDLGFVLLVIFIITTTPVVNDLEVNLPAAAPQPKDAPRKANFVTVDGSGALWLNQQPTSLAELPGQLAGLRAGDPDLNLIVRGDATTPYRHIRGVLDACRQANLPQVELATESRP